MFSNVRSILCLGLTILASVAFSQREVADSPPMGWNSYDCFSYAVNEAEVQANADYMVAHLKKYGWQYVVVDYVWSCPRLKADFAPNQDASFNPRLNMDANGRLLPDPDRFPSSANGKGFKALADAIHRRGLKFGIHLMRGIPRQAVAASSPVLGTNFTAADAYTKEHPCTWLNHMWGFDMAKPAAQAYLNSIFKLYAEWGVDLVKVDDLSSPYSTAEIEGYREAIAKSGRAIVLSLSPGPTPLSDGPHVSQYANMWRLLGDLWDNWGDLDNAFRIISDWTPFRGPSHWPDPDMLPLGRLRKYGPNTGPADTDSRFTKDEQKTLMTLWCISKCPLMFGGNLPETDPYTLSLITDPEVLDVDQRSQGNHAITNGLKPIWVAGSDDPKIKYLAVFNRSADPSTESIRLSDLAIKTCKVRDLWLRKDLPEATDTLAVNVPPHGAMMYKLYILAPADKTEAVLSTVNLTGKSYEAEDPSNTLSGQARIVDDIKDGHCSGEKMVCFIGSKPDNTLLFNNVAADKAGDYVLAIVYMAGSHRQMGVTVNGDPIKMVDFPATGGWDGRYLDAVEVKIHLNQGANKVLFSNPTDWGVNVDRVVIRPV